MSGFTDLPSRSSSSKQSDPQDLLTELGLRRPVRGRDDLIVTLLIFKLADAEVRNPRPGPFGSCYKRLDPNTVKGLLDKLQVPPLNEIADIKTLQNVVLGLEELAGPIQWREPLLAIGLFGYATIDVVGYM